MTGSIPKKDLMGSLAWGCCCQEQGGKLASPLLSLKRLRGRTNQHGVAIFYNKSTPTDLELRCELGE